MTISTQNPDIPHYTHAPETKENLDWADLAAVDMSNAHTPEGRKQLTKQVHDAIKNEGFLYVVNHGIPAEEVNRMFDLANYAVENVGEEEKQKYMGKIREEATYRGYKPRKFWHINGGVRDEIEQYNLNFREDLTPAKHPEPLRPFLQELDSFTKKIHFNVLNNLLRIIARTLEVDEEYFIQMHDHSANAETFLRLVKYFPRAEEAEKQAQGVWLKGHTDFGTLTILFSQPVSALQIFTKDGQWKWVKHIDNAIVVNIGDGIEFLSGGYYRSTVHRVRQPPDDQRDKTRVGLIYFAGTHDGVELRPIVESPLIRRVGASQPRFVDGKIPTAETYRKGRVTMYGGQQPLKRGELKNVDEEVIGGVLVQHYN